MPNRIFVYSVDGTLLHSGPNFKEFEAGQAELIIRKYEAGRRSYFLTQRRARLKEVTNCKGIDAYEISAALEGIEIPKSELRELKL